MTNARGLFVLLLICLALTALPVGAKEAAKAKKLSATSSSAPGEQLDISAEESLEWYQDSKLYVARGKARAVKGDMSVEADILSAHQRDKKDKTAKTDKADTSVGGDIDRIMAEGHVHITDPKQQVFGDKAVYDLDLRVLKITGSNLKYMTEKDVVTARDSLEYFEEKNMAIARGRAIGVHQDSRVEADVLTALFDRLPSGQMEMSHMLGKGNVIILTKDGAVSRGQRADYDVKKNVAILSGHVRVTRGDTQLEGDKAEVDFDTNQSRLLNSGSGRVRALLPSSKSKEGEKAKP